MNMTEMPKIPDALRRTSQQEPTDMNAQPATTTEENLETEAGVLAEIIADLDEQIKALQTKRTAKHKQLRAITSKLVTIKLKAK